MKRNIFTVIKIALLLMLFSNNAFSQGAPTTSGKDFWVSFGRNGNTIVTNISLQVRMVATKATEVRLSFTENSSLNETFYLDAGQVYTHNFTLDQKTAVYHSSTIPIGTTNKSLRITSDEDISVYAINLFSGTTDATNVLPVNNYGRDFFILSYLSTRSDGYTIIASEPGTTNVTNHSGATVSLTQGQVYSFYDGSLIYRTDLTGGRITSDKPIAIFTTNQSVQIPDGTTANECLFQQLAPVHSWGTTFLVPVTSATSSDNVTRDRDRIRIIASQDGTTITQTGGTVQSNVQGAVTTLDNPLNAGQFVELEINLANNGCYITADKPIAVASYLIGTAAFGSGNAFGDPAMAWIPPIEQTISSTIVAPFFSEGASILHDDQHYALIVTPTATKGDTRVTVGTGSPQPLFNGTWRDNAASGYSFYTMNFPGATAAERSNSYYFENPAGFIALGYGLGAAESYYYLAGSAARDLTASFYINDIHNQDANGMMFCNNSSFDFRAELTFMTSNNPGHLKWFVNGVEQTAARDQMTCSMSLSVGNNNIKLEVLNTQNQKTEIETTMIVVNCGAVEVTVCSDEVAVLKAELNVPNSITNPVYTWYAEEQGDASFIQNGPILTTSVPITNDTTFYVSVKGDNFCEGFRLPVNVIVEFCAELEDDYTTTFVNRNDTIPVLDNDTYPVSCELSIEPIVTSGPFAPGANYAINGKNIVYIPAPNFAGRDSIIYRLSCGGGTKTATVYINVVLTDSIMRKEATLMLSPEFKHNGTYPNPVSVLHGEDIKYEITVINANHLSGSIVITDTLPAYLKYVGGSASSQFQLPTTATINDSDSTTSSPTRGVIKWTFNNVASGDSVKAILRATPVDGASASQPLFINYAWVELGGIGRTFTNSTYHQGAGISIMTFSAGIGGEIFNATEQVLDYMTTPRSGVLIAPEEGYAFAGWSHRGYTSLRGVAIEAQAGIMHYDTLMVYGNVELHAEFVPVEALLKEEQEEAISEMPEEDKVWAVKDELFITTTNAGSIVRIYSTEGILREQHTIVSAGTTSRKLSRGIYIVTINNDFGNKVRIE